MKTAPVTLRPCDRAISRACIHWSMISQVARLRRVAIREVAQKSQAIAQPTCDERQTLTAPGLVQRDQHGLDRQPVVQPEQELLEAVRGRGDAPLQRQPGQAGRGDPRACAGRGACGPRRPGRGCPASSGPTGAGAPRVGLDADRRGPREEGLGRQVAGVDLLGIFEETGMTRRIPKGETVPGRESPGYPGAATAARLGRCPRREIRSRRQNLLATPCVLSEMSDESGAVRRGWRSRKSESPTDGRLTRSFTR